MDKKEVQQSNERQVEILQQESSIKKITIEDFPIVSPEGKPNSTLLELLHVLELTHDGTLDSIVSITQQKFFQRRPDGIRKERWEIDEVMPEFRGQVMPFLGKLGMLDEIPPANDEYDHVLIPGALVTRVRTRVKYVADLYQKGLKFKTINFLGGERPLADSGRETQDVLLDHNNKELPFREGWKPPFELPTTELGMMQLVWDQADLPSGLRRAEIRWINAPMKPNPSGGIMLRPTTEDTIKKWIETNPSSGVCLAISNNPHIRYQQSVLKTYLPAEFKVETVGSAASPNLPLAFYLGEMARWLYQERLRLKSK